MLDRPGRIAYLVDKDFEILGKEKTGKANQDDRQKALELFHISHKVSLENTGIMRSADFASFGFYGALKIAYRFNFRNPCFHLILSFIGKHEQYGDPTHA
jgi:hypothetical protein